MTTEIVSNEKDKAVIIESGYFYAVSREGNVVRFKPGRKKKEIPVPETPSQVVAEAVVVGEVPQ